MREVTTAWDVKKTDGKWAWLPFVYTFAHENKKVWLWGRWKLIKTWSEVNV